MTEGGRTDNLGAGMPSAKIEPCPGFSVCLPSLNLSGKRWALRAPLWASSLVTLLDWLRIGIRNSKGILYFLRRTWGFQDAI